MTDQAQAPAHLDRSALSVVEDLLHAQLEERSRVLLDVGPELGEVVESVRGALRGGKRLRASFCLWGARAVHGSEAQVAGVDEAAAALELFHLAALVHDDVMDRSASRRGSPTVHRQFAARHRDGGWAGAADGFGDSVAVLVGDLCLTWSDDLLVTGLARSAPTAPAARAVWEEMRTQVLAGQHLDLLAQARRTTSLAAAGRVLRYKSAKYTIEQPLRLGASIAGAGPELLAGLSRFGLGVGEAFQLRDDVLGVWGRPEQTGKPVLDDVREGKRTVLVVLATERADAAGRAVLQRHLGDPAVDAEGLDAVRGVLETTGARAEVEARIDRLTADAHDELDRLDRLGVDGRTREALAALTEACVRRAA